MIVIKNKSWYQLVFSFQGSGIIVIWKRVLFFFFFSFFASYAIRRWQLYPLLITPLPFTLIGTALGIFLGIRSNASYDRFWEGRKLWGNMVNTTRNLTRISLTWIQNTEGSKNTPTTEEEKKRLILLIIAFVHCTRTHLRDSSFDKLLGHFFSETEQTQLKKEENVPNAILHKISLLVQKLWKQGAIESYWIPMFEAEINKLTDVLGACERIKNTPIPVMYTIFTHRIVAVYCFALTFGIYKELYMLTPVVVLMISYAFLMLDFIGSEIEQPFGMGMNDLPLNQLSRTIEANLLQRMGETSLPPKVLPVNNVLN